MKRPSFLSYVIGNPIVMFGFWGLTAYAAYAAWRGEWSPVVAVILGMFSAGSMQASDRIATFNRWRREWEMMGGGSGSGFRLPRIPGLRVVAGLVVWVVMADYLLRHGDAPGMKVAATLFWLATGALIARGVYLLVKRGGGHGRRSKGPVAVTLLLPVPKGAGGLEQSYRALPDYCVALFRPQS